MAISVPSCSLITFRIDYFLDEYSCASECRPTVVGIASMVGTAMMLLSALSASALAQPPPPAPVVCTGCKRPSWGWETVGDMAFTPGRKRYGVPAGGLT